MTESLISHKYISRGMKLIVIGLPELRMEMGSMNSTERFRPKTHDGMQRKLPCPMCLRKG